MTLYDLTTDTISYKSRVMANFNYLASGNITALNLTSTAYSYIGASDTDGSWRFYINPDSNLAFEKRINGVWVVGQVISVE